MLTDWVLIGRLARELEERLRGARVENAGKLADGRIAVVFRARRTRQVLAIDLFTSPPLVTLETSDTNVTSEGGFTRVLSRSLEGMVLSSVSARRDDRLVRMTLTARSRFGVGDQFELYLELVPRFGNVVLVKGERIVAAYKEFAPSDNTRRAVQAGAPYALPPLPLHPRTLAPIASEADGQPPDTPLHAYHRDGHLLQAYLVSLPGFESAAHTRVSSLLDLFAELRDQQAALAGSQASNRRRQAILKRLEERERRLGAELDSLSERLRRAEDRQTLRVQGEAIFADLHALDESERAAAKERAGEFFAEYKKLGKSLPHLLARQGATTAALEAVEMLRWETERAADDDLEEIAAAVAELRPRRGSNAPRPSLVNRKRPWLELRTSHGSRIVVGRSPLENAELTFRVARPNDLWFHARGIPGAHVILARDERSPAPDEDLQIAASLAAFHSRAGSAAAVPVDYTLRKHVRKQRAAPPGLVWYTHAQTIIGTPSDAPI